MTRRIASIVVAAAAVLTFGHIACADDTFSAQIPFPFVAAGRHYQPGRYDVRVFNDHFNVMLRGDKGQAATLTAFARVATDRPASDDDPRLVFDKVGDTYYLSEVWFEGYAGYALQPPTPAPASRTAIVTRGAGVTR